MSHDVESMFYVNEVPWHGLGTPLEDPPTIEEGIRLAGLDWKVDTQPLYLGDGTEVTGKKAVVRDSDDSILGIVGKKWTPLQNTEAFNFFQPFLDSGECVLETAGSLKRGKHVFVLARIKGDPIEVVKGDEFLQYFLLANGHDGTLAVNVQITPIRVVCANTLAASLEGNSGRVLRSIHSQQVHTNLEAIQETVNLAKRNFEASAEQYRYLASRQVNLDDLNLYVEKVFFPKKKLLIEVEDKSKSVPNMQARIAELFESGRGNDLPGVKGTWWAAYNAANEYLSYGRGRSNDARMDSLWFGQAKTLNSKALALASQMAG